MPDNKDTNEIYEFFNHPDKYLKKLEEKKESIKKEVADKLPPDLKPYMQGNTGDIVIFIILMLILVLVLKVINIAIRVILNIIGIASIIFVVYLLIKHFASGG